MGKLRLGVDLGGTKIETAVMDTQGSILRRERINTPPDYDATVRALKHLLDGAERDCAAPMAAIGVAMPGSPSPRTGLIRNANSTWLNGRPFGRDLAHALALPVRLANDANCFALSEAVDGAGAGAGSVFGVIIGTGCGGGLVINARLVEGASAIAGEWGHTPLPWPTTEESTPPRCWCGKTGCLETWISGPAFAADHAKVTGQPLTAEEIALAARLGAPAAQASIARLADRIARGLAVVINIVDPERIVLGGGLSNIEILPELVGGKLSHYVFSDGVTAQVVRNRHGDSSGVRGAGWLWPIEELE
jgi:fructokinase